MTSIASRETFEITFTPADSAEREDGRGSAGTYRMVQAGICGPFGADVAADCTFDAEEAALRYNLMRDGEWKRAANGYWYCPAVKVA